MRTDPVCGMQVDEKTAQAKSMHNGQPYAFCSSACKEKFDRNPERYTHSERQAGREKVTK